MTAAPPQGPTVIEPQEESIRPETSAEFDGTPIRAWRVGNRVGEAPAWHPGQRCLYWIDVRGQQLLRLQPAAGELTRWMLPEVVGALALCDDDRAILAFPQRLVSIDLQSNVLRDIASVERERPTNRLNEGKVSPSGRWWVFGSMDDRPDKAATGALYCMGADAIVRRLHDGLVIANGIAWSPDGTTLYFSDSFAGQLYAAAWDDAAGTMGRPTLHARLDEAAGRPDGAAIDVAGNYWSAGVSAGCINVLDPRGAIMRKIAVPCQAPTMPAFAGTGSMKVFVTSLIRPHWTRVGPWDGALLEIETDITGIIPPLFRLAAA